MIDEIASTAVNIAKTFICERKFVIRRQHPDEEDVEFQKQVEHLYNLHYKEAPAIEWKLGSNDDLVAIVSYTQLKEKE